jgi:hypothetical protein
MEAARLPWTLTHSQAMSPRCREENLDYLGLRPPHLRGAMGGGVARGNGKTDRWPRGRGGQAATPQGEMRAADGGITG